MKTPHLQLGLVGVWTGVCHAEHPPAGMGEVGPELILEGFSPEGLSSCKSDHHQQEPKDAAPNGNQLQTKLLTCATVKPVPINPFPVAVICCTAEGTEPG